MLTSPPALQEQSFLRRRTFHLIRLDLRVQRIILKVIEIQVHISIRRPLPRCEEHLSSIDARVGHESKQQPPAVFLCRKNYASLLDTIESTSR